MLTQVAPALVEGRPVTVTGERLSENFAAVPMLGRSPEDEITLKAVWSITHIGTGFMVAPLVEYDELGRAWPVSDFDNAREFCEWFDSQGDFAATDATEMSFPKAVADEVQLFAVSAGTWSPPESANGDPR